MHAIIKLSNVEDISSFIEKVKAIQYEVSFIFKSSKVRSGFNKKEQAQKAIKVIKQCASIIKVEFSKIPSENFENFTSALIDKKMLRFLDLRDNQIRDREVKLVINSCKFLTSLNLSENYIRNDGAIAIAKSCNFLTCLDLGYNHIGFKGAMEIANNLKNWKLKYLDLSHIVSSYDDKEKLDFNDDVENLDDEELIEILTVVLKNDNIIENFYFDINGVDSFILSAVKDDIINKSSLMSLSLRDNKLNYKSIDAIAQIIKNSPHLASLNLSENDIGTKNEDQIVAAVNFNNSLTKFKLDEISNEAYDKIHQRLDHNQDLINKFLNLLKEFFIDQNDVHFVKMLNAAKFYEKIPKNVWKKILQDERYDIPESVIENMDNFVMKNPFAIAGICKNIHAKSDISPSGHISNLPDEIINCIASYLSDDNWGLRVKEKPLIQKHPLSSSNISDTLIKRLKVNELDVDADNQISAEQQLISDAVDDQTLTDYSNNFFEYDF